MADAPKKNLQWITRRSHLQVSAKDVLPVIFKSPKASASLQAQKGPVPEAFPRTEVQLSDSLDLVKEWLLEHIDRMYRLGDVNLKPGSFETPHVLRNGTHRFTVWFEPTGASFSVLIPNKQLAAASEQSGADTDDVPNEDENKQDFDGYTPTPQTLHVVGELEK